jgi:hypothetical protein
MIEYLDISQCVHTCNISVEEWDKPTPEASDGGIHGQDQGLAGEDVCA